MRTAMADQEQRHMGQITIPPQQQHEIRQWKMALWKGALMGLAPHQPLAPTPPLGLPPCPPRHRPPRPSRWWLAPPAPVQGEIPQNLWGVPGRPRAGRTPAMVGRLPPPTPWRNLCPSLGLSLFVQTPWGVLLACFSPPAGLPLPAEHLPAHGSHLGVGVGTVCRVHTPTDGIATTLTP